MSVESTTETSSKTVSHKSKVFFAVVSRCKRIICFVIVAGARELNFFKIRNSKLSGAALRYVS